MNKIVVKFRMKKSPFDIERKREELAKSRQYSELGSTYSKEFSEIDDLNSPKFWDLLNQADNVSNRINPMARDRINTVKQLIPKDASKIIDIGFGSAQLEKSVLLAKKKIQWFGVDISYKSVKRASILYPQGKFKTGNITRLKYQNGFFDCAIALEVLEHIKPSLTFRALSEVHRVLKSNGVFIISVPLNENLEEMVLRGENPNAHLRVYSQSLIKAELEMSNFKILKEKTLYAFNNGYMFKTLIAKLIPGIRKPNNIIILAQKI